MVGMTSFSLGFASRQDDAWASIVLMYLHNTVLTDYESSQPRFQSGVHLCLQAIESKCCTPDEGFQGLGLAAGNIICTVSS